MRPQHSVAKRKEKGRKATHEVMKNVRPSESKIYTIMEKIRTPAKKKILVQDCLKIDVYVYVE